MQGTIPIVVTFHDTNAYTARHLDDYLRCSAMKPTAVFAT